MEPHKTTPSQARESRRRSRSPLGTNDHSQLSWLLQNRRNISPSPSEFEKFVQEAQASQEKDDAEFEAERARRQALSPKERLEEDANKLRQKIEADPRMFVSLEISRSLQAQCRADNCVYLRAKVPTGDIIKTHYRICFRGAETVSRVRRTTHHYHVLCFESMVRLRDLVPSKVKMASSSGRWGLMVEKWFEHKGRIDLDKIAVFLEELAIYDAEYSEWCSRYTMRSLDHERNCKDKEPECKCPGPPPQPERPQLGNYTTDDGVMCPLFRVLRHPLVEKRDWTTEDELAGRFPRPNPEYYR